MKFEDKKAHQVKSGLEPLSSTIPDASNAGLSPSQQSISHYPLEQHLAEYKRQGFTIFRGFLPPERVQEIRAICDPLFDELMQLEHHRNNPLARDTIGGHDGWQEGRQTALGTMLMDATVFNPSGLLLDFTEMLMGPSVQHDSLQVAGYPSVPLAYRGIGYGWHHDGFNTAGTTTKKGPKAYTYPLACNCLTYLQDMTLERGPFRCVPGSHLDFSMQVPLPSPDNPAEHWSVPGEICVDGRAGDLVVTHCDLLHGSTHNTAAGEYRYFISEYVQQAGLPHRDNMDDAAWAHWLAAARQQEDKRILRFFGEGKDAYQAALEESWRQQSARSSSTA